MQTLTSKSLEETEGCAKEFVRSLKTNESGATVVCLKGDLGSGKTTFVQAVARTLGVEDTVTSPTFVIEKIYDTKDSRFARLVHIDAYRLEEGRELSALGWDAMMKDAGVVVFIEWPENVKDVIPKDARHLAFTFVDDTTREITIE